SATLLALMTTTKSPVSTCGAKVGLCLPRSSVAAWVARRPSTTSDASMTCHSRSISPGFGLYVRTGLPCLVMGMSRWLACPAGLHGPGLAGRRQPARNSHQRYLALAGRVKRPPDGHGDVAHGLGEPGHAAVGRRGHVQAMLLQPLSDRYGEQLAHDLDARPGDPERL